jgi:hypothetical protein
MNTVKNYNRIIRQLSSFSLIREHDVVKDGSLRISTSFQYPNGSNIDVFFHGQNGLLELSDKGQTMDYLDELVVKKTDGFKKSARKVCEMFDVQLIGNTLKMSLPFSEAGDISDQVTMLSVACLKLADLR